MKIEIIKFYSVNNHFGEFSNFAPYPIKIKGKIWPTTEHYFQAQKFANTPYETKIRKASSPQKAAQMGRSRKIKLRLDWERIKDNIMYEAVKSKFSQHQDLKELLLSTGNAKIIEHTKNDSYWGDGGAGTGKNKLGKILMKVREFLQTKS